MSLKILPKALLFLCLVLSLQPLFGQEEYDWLEAIQDNEVKSWIKEQNRDAEKILQKARKKFGGYTAVNRYNYVDREYLQPEGKHFYTFRFERLNRTPSLYMREKIKHNDHLLVGANDFSLNDRINIYSIKESEDARYLGVLFGRNGSDWREIKVKKLKASGYLEDHLVDVKFSHIDWFKDGFFYLKYPRNGQFDAEGNPELKYHQLGTDQKEDKTVFSRNTDKVLDLDFHVLPGGAFLIVEETIDDDITNYYYVRLGDNMQVRPLLPKFDGWFNALANVDDVLIFTTSHEAGENTVNILDVNDPTKWNVHIKTPDKKVLEWARIVCGKLVCNYNTFREQEIRIYDLSGQLLKTISFEEGFEIDGFSAGNTGDIAIFSFGNELIPDIVYQIDMKTFEQKLLSKTKITYDVDRYERLYSSYISHDGTEVPLTILKRKDISLYGNNPTLLKAYGGFGSSYEASYDAGLIYFLEEGGVFVYAHIRGGGELGPEWAEAGQGMNKPTTIKDFISAAEHLIDKGVTSSEKLGITGSSHGGMVVGAAMALRPDLFRVAVPIVGVFDMIDAENYTVGVFHTDEFGATENEDELAVLKTYSPLQNLKANVNYPACLVITAENDDRVPPFHSYKFFAKLKDLSSKPEDVFLKVEKKAGHYGASDIEAILREDADMYSFVLYYTAQ